MSGLPAEMIERARDIQVEDELDRRGAKLRGRSDKIGPCPLCGGHDRFSVSVRRQLWHCRGCCKGGRDAISLTMHLDGLDFRGAVLALTGAREPAERKPPAPTATKPDDANLGRATAIWEAAGPIEGTEGEVYLAKRGITLADVPEHGDLRWHPRCPWEGGTKPCILARYSDAISAEPRGIWRRPISGEKPKSFGPHGGCVIWLWPDDEITIGLVLGEGVETTLAAATRIKYRGTFLRPAWAAGSAGNMATFPPLGGIEALTLLVDHDDAGERAADQCERAWLAAGKEVIRLTPNDLGADFNDLVRS